MTTEKQTCYRSAAGRDAIGAWARSRLEYWDVPHDSVLRHTGLGKTHLVHCGQGEHSFLVLPGTNMSAAVMLDPLCELGRGGRVTAVDLPGQLGLSDGRRPHGGLAELGRWADEIVDSLEGPVTVIGHSLGAAIALSMTPSAAIAGLVLVAPAGFIDVRPTPRLLASTLAWIARPTFRSAARLVRYMSGPTAPIDSRLVEWMRLVGHHSRPSGAPGSLPDELIARWDATSVLILAGGHDRFFPLARLRRRAAHFGFPIFVAAEAGHLLPLERPELLAARTMTGTTRPDRTSQSLHGAREDAVPR